MHCSQCSIVWIEVALERVLDNVCSWISSFAWFRSRLCVSSSEQLLRVYWSGVRFLFLFSFNKWRELSKLKTFFFKHWNPCQTLAFTSLNTHILHFIAMFMSRFVHSVTGCNESEGYEPWGLQLIASFQNLKSGIRKRWPDFCCLVGPNEICSHRANQQSPEIKQNTGKWMFSNQLLFLCIGTSNWSENYFTDTAGVGLIIKQNSTNLQRRQQPVQEQLKDLFDRDWNSKYAVNLEDVQGHKDCNWD